MRDLVCIAQAGGGGLLHLGEAGPLLEIGRRVGACANVCARAGARVSETVNLPYYCHGNEDDGMKMESV